MSLIDDLKGKYARQSGLGQLIIVIVCITLIIWLLDMILPVERWLRLPSNLWDVILQPWSLITYSFLHSGFLHLFFNMIILFVFGNMMLNLFKNRQLITLFFAGVLSGAAFYLLGSYLFSSFFSSSGLIGASAGVYAVAIFVCAYQPENELRLFFFPLKLKYIGYALLVYVIAQIIGGINIGGHVAHIGGAAIGYYTAIKMRDGVDILKGLASIGDLFSSLFKPSPKKEKKAKMKTVYRNKNIKKKPVNIKSENQVKIDSILDKISASGYESLTKAEKDFLFKSGKD